MPRKFFYGACATKKRPPLELKHAKRYEVWSWIQKELWTFSKIAWMLKKILWFKGISNNPASLPLNVSSIASFACLSMWMIPFHNWWKEGLLALWFQQHSTLLKILSICGWGWYIVSKFFPDIHIDYGTQIIHSPIHQNCLSINAHFIVFFSTESFQQFCLGIKENLILPGVADITRFGKVDILSETFRRFNIHHSVHETLNQLTYLDLI